MLCWSCKESLVIMATRMNRSIMVGIDSADGARRCPWALHFSAFEVIAARPLWLELISTSPAVKTLGCSCAAVIILGRIYSSPEVCLLSPFICHTLPPSETQALCWGYWGSGSVCKLEASLFLSEWKSLLLLFGICWTRSQMTHQYLVERTEVWYPSFCALFLCLIKHIVAFQSRRSAPTFLCS